MTLFHLPSKNLGQNYLIDQNIVGKIVDSFAPDRDDYILEIGPGKGALTESLIENCDNYRGIELDKINFSELKTRFDENYFINENILDIDLSKIFPGKTKRIIGNIPYNISTPIYYWLLDQQNEVSDCQFLVQLEFAEKIRSKESSEGRGILSVLYQTYSEIKQLFKVSRNVFYPKPKIWSSVEKYVFNSSYDLPRIELYEKIVKTVFGNRRKTIINCLRNSIFVDCNLSEIPLDLQKRAEQLSIEEFFLLYKHINRNYHGK
ncbi:MAG: 16S rRNA (adenine(1518)-N(6)/adenine(1519)-N(6))-dimethyltransferase RsmA [Melioribacteraceae bacterium]|nr:16S rRNA (adenine(1518)-N(6)/adenine(1519)-N(6))-dimethyltransferase RsmA [Melioribacteraceae bacterium]MCF8265394.1 16S rRNA (adenine(1518)-N(6)/adenine(1519)-N(6))-dimethyltransferase RsmA [Melioribacteraceae bacterium]